MANLDRDEWPLPGEHTNKTGSSVSKATQTEKLSIQNNKGSAKAKGDVTSPPKKSSDGTAKDAKESNPSHKANSIWDDASRATTSQPRDTDRSDHQPISTRPKPRPEPKSGRKNSSRTGVQEDPERLYYHDKRKDDDRRDRFDDMEEDYHQNTESKRGRGRG